MGQYNTGVLTTAGQQLITQALAGDGVISFPAAKTSSWAIPAGTNIQALTDLQDIQQTVTPGTAQVFNGTMIQVQALFSNADEGAEVTQAYLVQTVGLWAQITGGEPTLFSVYQATTPDQMPAYAGKAPSSLIYTLQATVQQASQLTVQVNPAGAATALDIQNLQTQITQIENNYIPKTQIGAASGVAGLGTNSAVPITQGGTGGNTVTEALANLGAQPGFNLLVNSRFKYNGRNQSSYTGAGFTVDGWQSSAYISSVSIQSVGVNITPTGNAVAIFCQNVLYYGDLTGETVTFSVVTSNGDASLTVSIPSGDFNSSTVSIGNSSWYIRLYRSESNPIQCRVMSLSGIQSTETLTLTAAKLELGSVSTLAADLAQGQDETIEQLRLDMYDLDPGRPAYILTQNKNLLDNWYFVGGGSQQGGGQFPINQRGQTSYTQPSGSSTQLDRWKQYDNSQIQIFADNISISNSSSSATTFIENCLEWNKSLFGIQITASVLLGDGVLLTCTGKTPSSVESGTQQVCVSNTYNGVTLRVYAPNAVGDFAFQFMISPSSSATILAAKLELGPRSTLARLVDGEWVLNDPPPNFQQELAKCQRYLFRISPASNGIVCTIGNGWVDSLNGANIYVNTPPMRSGVASTLIQIGTFYLGTVGAEGSKAIPVTSVTLNIQSDTTIQAKCVVSEDLTLGYGAELQIRDSNSAFLVSREL